MYNSLKKREKRECRNPQCNKNFEITFSKKKKFCSSRCAAIVNNSKKSTLTEQEIGKIVDLYKQGYSMEEVSKLTNISYSKVNYWLKKKNIPRRSLSEALYKKYNFEGDPFCKTKIDSRKKAFLFGLGLGLYWGEGTKKNERSIRLGNSDPYLIKAFIAFLEKIYNVDRDKLKFGLQVFNDMNPQKAKSVWVNHLQAREGQFGKIVVTPARSIGNYREKTKHGVLTIYFGNTKLRKIFGEEIEKLKNRHGSSVG